MQRPGNLDDLLFELAVFLRQLVGEERVAVFGVGRGRGAILDADEAEGHFIAVGGDTLYAASKVLSVEGDKVTFRLVGVKNRTSASAYAEHGDALFADELSKKDAKLKEKVVEITRTLFVRRRP